MLKAIETSYKGYRFRSRLEARWAVFFDALGVAWEYEPEGFETSAGWYLPDFVVRKAGSPNVWVEVRPVDVREPKVTAFNLLLRGAGLGEHCQFVFGDPLAWFEWRRARHSTPQHLAWTVGNPRFDRADPRNIPFVFAGSYLECQFPPGADILAAGAKARAARFEHGESGT